MTVNFGDIRSAIHSGGELPEGWMEDERAREYVLDAEWNMVLHSVMNRRTLLPLIKQYMHIKAGSATVLLMSDAQTNSALQWWARSLSGDLDLGAMICNRHRNWIAGDAPPPPWICDT